MTKKYRGECGKVRISQDAEYHSLVNKLLVVKESKTKFEEK